MPPNQAPEIANRIRQMMSDLGIQSERKFARRAGLAVDTHLNAVLKRLDGGHTIDLDTATKLAHAGGRSLTWLATGREEAGGVMLREVAAWKAAEAEARHRFPDVPDFAITAVGHFRAPVAPDKLDGVTLRDMARAWYDALGPDARRKAEREHVLGT